MLRPKSGQLLGTFSHYSDPDLLPYPWGLARTPVDAPPGLPKAVPGTCVLEGGGKKAQIILRKFLFGELWHFQPLL